MGASEEDKATPKMRSERVSKNGKFISDVGTAMTCGEVNNRRKGAKSSTAKYGSSCEHPCYECEIVKRINAATLCYNYCM